MHSKPIILFLASWFPHREHATIGNFVQRHAECIQEKAEIHVLFAISTQNCSKEFEIVKTVENGVSITRVYYAKVKSKLPGVAQYLKLQKYIKALRLGFNSFDVEFDLCHLNVAYPAGLFAVYLKKKYNIKYVLSSHWTGFLSNTRGFEKLNLLVKYQYKNIFSEAEKVLPVSAHLGDSLKSLNLISDYEVLPNTVDDTLFYPIEKKIENNQFIHISTIDEEHKNFSGILAAFSKLKQANIQFNLKIITDGDFNYAQSKIKEFDLIDEIELFATQSPKQIAVHLRNSHCLVQFSNTETFSIVLAEAWMTGIPTIYSKCGGLTEIKNSLLGIQIEPKSIQQLFLALKKYAEPNFVYNKHAIREYAVSNFSKEFVAKRTKNIYDKIRVLHKKK